MFIKQLYTGCLSEAAYYIESDGVAAVVDPLRDIDSYVQLARERKAEIKYIFETHFHADFVSGHLDLQKLPVRPSFTVQIQKPNSPFTWLRTAKHFPG